MAETTKNRRSAARGRGSKEAVAKRRAARELNSLLGKSRTADHKLDGRTEKRRRRLFQELLEGRNGEPLKPIDVVSHTDDLLQLGESFASLRKAGVKPRKIALDESIVASIEKTQAAYSFKPASWKILGVSIDENGSVVAKSRRKRSSK